MVSSEFLSFKKYLKRHAALKSFFLFIFLMHEIQTCAQERFSDNLNVMAQLHFGYNLPEYPFLSSITKDNIQSVDICLFKETAGKNEWEQLYNYPEYGLSFFYSTLGNDQILGREFALSYFFRIYLLNRKHIRLFNRVGIGLSYVSRKFDLHDNYFDVAVGSNLNIHFNYGIGATRELSDKLTLNAGLSFDHFSNANTSEPNLGINYLTAYGGVSYAFGKKYKRQPFEISPHVKNNSVALFASLGGKHSRALTSKFFATSSFSLEFDRYYSRIFHFGIGTDLFYDSSVESSLEKKNEIYKPSNSFQTGIHLSQSLIYNKLSLSVQEGAYILLTEKAEGFIIYNRGLIQYKINDHIIIRLAMKSHLQILDYPEIGIGYKL